MSGDLDLGIVGLDTVSEYGQVVLGKSCYLVNNPVSFHESL